MATQHLRHMQRARYGSLSWCIFALVFCILSSSSHAHASSLYELAPAATSKAGRLGFQLKWQPQRFQGNGNYLSGYWDPTPIRGLAPQQHSLPGYVPLDLGLAAVLRLQRNDGTGFYAEAGTGPRYQSHAYDLAGRTQSSRLALNTVAGIGFVWKNGVDLGFKAIHVTRGQGKEGNEPGNMVGIDLKYRW